jgi:hypothetical protein
MEEEMMNGMAAPQDAPMETAPAAPTEEQARESKFDMETLMGNFLDMPEDRRKLATRLLATPAASLFDDIVGEPIMQRLITQLGDEVAIGPKEEAPAAEGMMAPTAEPMAEAPEPATPMEDEEATPPV